MNRTIHAVYLLLIVIFYSTTAVKAQEYAGHLNCNPTLYNKKQPSTTAKKTTAKKPAVKKPAAKKAVAKKPAAKKPAAKKAVAKKKK